MKHILPLLTALVLTPLAALRAAEAHEHLSPHQKAALNPK